MHMFIIMKGGGVSFNSGVSCKLIDGERGMFNNEQLVKAINPPDFYHSPKTSLVCIENTTIKEVVHVGI